MARVCWRCRSCSVIHLSNTLHAQRAACSRHTRSIVVTAATLQFEMSPLKLLAFMNMPLKEKHGGAE